MSVRFVPVHDAAAMLRVDLPIYRAVWGTSVLDAAGLHSGQDAFELGLAHSKTIVLYGKGALGLVEVEGQAFVHVDRAKGTHAGLCPRDAEESGEQFRRRSPVARWNDRVVELNAHLGNPCREQWVGRGRSVLTEDLAAWRSLELDNIPFWVRNIDGGTFSFCAETRGNRADFDAMRLQMVANTRLIEWLYPEAEVIQVSRFCAWRCAADSPKFAIDGHEINDGSARAQLNQA